MGESIFTMLASARIRGMMTRMMHTCQFVKAAQLLRLPYQDRRPKEDAVCSRPAEREMTFNANMEPFWLCAEHYDLLIGDGGSERGASPCTPN
jgi:hypothetical protein